jgi:hypothetical protein
MHRDNPGKVQEPVPVDKGKGIGFSALLTVGMTFLPSISYPLQNDSGKPLGKTLEECPGSGIYAKYKN